MHQWLQQTDLLHHFMLAAQLKQPVIQLGLFLPNQASQGNGRPHVGKRFVGMTVVNAIGLAQQFQTQAGAPVLLWPLNAFRAQGIGGAHNVDQVPAAIASLPFTGIGVEKVAVKAVAGHFIVEAQGVVAGTTGARLRQLGMHPSHELGFAQALLRQQLRRDACHQAGRRVRQDVVRRSAIKADWFVDFVEVEVSAQAGHLQRPIAARVDAGGFIVVPENAGGHGVVLYRGRPDSSAILKNERSDGSVGGAETEIVAQRTYEIIVLARRLQQHEARIVVPRRLVLAAPQATGSEVDELVPAARQGHTQLQLVIGPDQHGQLADDHQPIFRGIA